MSFYGGNAGQHFYIADVFTDYDAMTTSTHIFNNQFVLLCFDALSFNIPTAIQTQYDLNSNDLSTLWIKYDGVFKFAGKVGAFTPTIDSNGDWSIGGVSMNESATPDQLYLQVPYTVTVDPEDETKEILTYIPDADGKCYIKYAYDKKGLSNDTVTQPWHNLVEITGLHTFDNFVKEINESKKIIKDQHDTVLDRTNLILALTELNKSYVEGTGKFVPDENSQYSWMIPSEYEEEINSRLNQDVDNAKRYYEDALAAAQKAEDLASTMDEYRNEITSALRLNETLTTDEKVDAWRAMVTAELSAAARETMNPKTEKPLLTERLNKLLYQFDTFADMRNCTLLRPGDTCVTFGISRLGDGHSLLFRVYEDEEDMIASGDLKLIDGKYYISLPGGNSELSEKQVLKNGYIAYSISMFSGLGSGGGGGSSGVSKGGITTSFNITAVALGAEIEIPIEWQGKVSGDGTLHVFERAQNESGGREIITQKEFPEGNQTFTWKATVEGARTLVVYVTDRDNNSTNQLRINITVGGLKIALSSTTPNDRRFTHGKDNPYTSFNIQSIKAGEVMINYSINNIPYPTQKLLVQANTLTSTNINFNNLVPGGYSVKFIFSQEGLPDTDFTYYFSIIEAGKVSIIVDFDTSKEYPQNKNIIFSYKTYYESITNFTNEFYLAGDSLIIEDDGDYIDTTGRKYKKIGETQSGTSQLDYTIDPIALSLKEQQTYYLMIKSFCTNYTNIKGQINQPIVFKVGNKQNDKIPASSWGAESLLYYFDARQGQTNQDKNKTIWTNLANRYRTSDQNTGNQSNDGKAQLILEEDSFNWVTNGWSPPGHENSLYFNGTARAYFDGIDKDCFEEGNLTTHKFLPVGGKLFGICDSQDNITQEGQGVTFSFYLKSEDTGVDARLFELPFVYGDGEIGIAINTSQAKISTSLDDYFGITTTFKPGQKTHITFTYEKIGVTKYRPDPEREKTNNGGLARIYIDGICRAAAVITSDFFINSKFITSTARFNDSENDKNLLDTSDENYGKPKYEQGAFELYSMRIFNRGLSHNEVLYNYIHDLADENLQDTELDFNKLMSTYKITNPEVWLHPEDGNLTNITKDQEKVMDVTYWPSTDVNSQIRFSNCEVKWQGTSSIAYPIKNYKIKFGDLIINEEEQYEKVKLQLDENKNLIYNNENVDKHSLFGKPERTYTLKADYMNSSHCHNTCNARFVNDTGLLTKYSLTPAQVLDICQLNEDLLKKEGYEDILDNVANGNYYYRVSEGVYRPYKISDFPESVVLQIRNTIYGIPCELYLINAENEKIFLGLYNFNNDKGNLSTFGLYRDDSTSAKFPGCTSFEIAANSNSTSGAFKKRQTVKHVEYDAKGNEKVLGYYATNLDTLYALNQNGKDYDIILSDSNKADASPCECVKYTLDTSTWTLSLSGWDDRQFLPHNTLIEIEGTPEEIVNEIWGADIGGTEVSQEVRNNRFNSILKSYNNLAIKYYSNDFELRAPDCDDYYIDEEKTIPTNEYYDEYNKIKLLVEWANNADEATFKREFRDHFDLDTTLNYYIFVMTVGLIDNFGKNLMVNTWGCDKNGQIPYIYYTDITDNTRYYKVRQFIRDTSNVNDLGHYNYGYSTCEIDNNDNIIIYGMDDSGEIDKNNILATFKETYKWNCTDYILNEGDPIKYGYWQKTMDESRFIWYPHPYDLDSCLGLDNMGYRRYGTDIEMLPNTPLDGFNDYYAHKYYADSTPFNTATSNLWHKFYKYFATEITDRYTLLRANGILSLETFQKFYYDDEIKLLNRKNYNEDMWFKYLDGNAVDVVVQGKGAKANPTQYIHMCHGDDWDRTRQWIQKRITFLDSLYQYESMNNAIVIRGSQGTYNLNIGVYDPQYMAIAWSNKGTEADPARKIVWTDTDTQELYGLVYNLYSLTGTTDIEYGFIKISKNANDELNYNSNLYKMNSDGTYTLTTDGTGVYYKIYGVNKNNSIDFTKWTPIVHTIKYGYYTYWIPDILSSNQGSFQRQKVEEKYEEANDKYSRVRLVKPTVAYSNGSTTNDQEIMIYGAPNIRTVDDFTSLNPKVLMLEQAYNLLGVKCNAPDADYSSLNLSGLTRLRKIDVQNSLNLSGNLDISNMPNLTDLNISLTGITGVTFPSDGGNLQKLHLNSSITNLHLANQRQLSSVILEARLKNYSTNTKQAVKEFGLIDAITLINCPKISFNFAAVTYNESTDKYSSVLLPWDTTLTAYVDNYGIFSMFKSLSELTLDNSCLQAVDSNNHTVIKDNEFKLTIPIGTPTTSNIPGYSGQQTYSTLRYLDLQNMPIIKKFSINANTVKYDPSSNDEFSWGSVVFPGAALIPGSKFLLHGFVEEIAVTGNGNNSIYMPCINDWRSFDGLKKISFNNIKIANKEQRFNTDKANVNILSLVLPDVPSLKEIAFNEKLPSQTNEITSIFFGDINTNLSDYITTTTAIATEAKNIKNTIDLTNNNLAGLKMNFTGFKNIETIKGLDQVLLDMGNNSTNIPKVTSFESFFANCNKLNQLLDSDGKQFKFVDRAKNSWNKFKKNPSFANMFKDCYKIKWEHIKDFLSHYGPDNEYLEEGDEFLLTTAANMFYNCTSLDQLQLHFSGMKYLESLTSVAERCRELSTFNLTLYHTENLRDLSKLISQVDEKVTNKLTDFKLNVYYQDDIETSNLGLQTVTTMESMLNNCNSLTYFDMSDWFKEPSSAIISLNSMCNNNTSLTSIGLSDLYNFSYLTNANSIFQNCEKLESFNSVWKFDSPVSLNNIFAGCSSLDISSLKNWDLKNVTSINSFLANAGKEKIELDISKWDLTQITKASNAFYKANISALKLTDENGNRSENLYFTNLTDADGLISETALEEFDSSLIPYSAPLKKINSIFYKCPNLKSLKINQNEMNKDYRYWNVNAVQSYEKAFSETALSSLDLSNWNFTNATNYTSMFQSSAALETIDGLEKLFPTEKISNRTIISIFSGCSKLKFDTIKETKDWFIYDNITNECVLTSLEGVFAGCTNITSLEDDAGQPTTFLNYNKKFNKVESIKSSFNNCSSCTKIRLPEMNSIKDASYAFSNCKELQILDISKVNFYKCGVGKLIDWLSGNEKLGRIIFQKADAAKQIGFKLCDIDISPLVFNNSSYFLDNNTLEYFSLKSVLVGEYERSGNTVGASNQTCAISQAILPSSSTPVSGNDKTNDINYANIRMTTDQLNAFKEKRTNKWADELTSTYDSEFDYILNVKHWFPGVGEN